MTLDLGYNDEQQALASSVRGFCERHATDEVVRGQGVPEKLWRQLGDLGVLALATPEGGGGALEIAAAMEELGRAAFPGPLVPTFLAMQLLDESEREAVAAGAVTVAVGTPRLFPWAAAAEVFVELDGDRAWRARLAGDVEPVDTLGREPWGRVELERERELDGVPGAVALADAALAAYLVGAAEGLLEVTAQYAMDRVQFGRAIGEFQAVAHPLADSKLEVTAAGHLARIAAYDWDEQGPAARASAATARLSAGAAALAAAYRAHQTFGAIGFTEEGPVGHVSQRIRQVSLMPPGDGAARTAVLEANDF